MTDRPIIFSAPMIRALLDGRKTQTRRIIKLPAGRLLDFCGGRGDKDDPAAWGWEDPDHGDWVTLEKKPGQRMGWRDWRGAYRPGDRLWVREAHTITTDGKNAVYRVDATDTHGWRWSTITPGDPQREVRWSPSIHMPRWASRLTLTVTDVRVQRLQEISEADVAAEGTTRGFSGGPHGEECLYEDFAGLWNSIHGPGAWDANPWVVALTFDVDRCNIDQMEFGS